MKFGLEKHHLQKTVLVISLLLFKPINRESFSKIKHLSILPIFAYLLTVIISPRKNVVGFSEKANIVKHTKVLHTSNSAIVLMLNIRMLIILHLTQEV